MSNANSKKPLRVYTQQEFDDAYRKQRDDYE